MKASGDALDVSASGRRSAWLAGRVRDVVTGPDGLLYVALQLPGVKLSSSTPGVVVRLVPIE